MLKRLQKNWREYATITIFFCIMFAGFCWPLGLLPLMGRLMFDWAETWLFEALQRINQRDKMEQRQRNQRRQNNIDVPF